jgi:hypothetical protein
MNANACEKCLQSRIVKSPSLTITEQKIRFLDALKVCVVIFLESDSRYFSTLPLKLIIIMIETTPCSLDSPNPFLGLDKPVSNSLW